MCDVAYCLWWARVEREHLAVWQAAMVANAMGAGMTVPSLTEAQETFDAALAAPPAPRDRIREATLRLFTGRAA